jgi:divinyl chlorophyllide a 8-vinyl-reductase
MQANRNALDGARSAGASHFITLSAICVQKPLLEFQRAKLKFETELMGCRDITHSIVRPSAFFKCMSRQVAAVKQGGPFVMFGNGRLAVSKPISEEDLAAFVADCVLDEDKVDKVRRSRCHTYQTCDMAPWLRCY